MRQVLALVIPKPFGGLGPVWLLVVAASAALMGLRNEYEWLVNYPGAWTLPIAALLDAVMAWFVDNLKWMFRSVSWLLEWPMVGIRTLFNFLPWVTTAALITLIAWQGGGRRPATFTLVALMYIVLVGYWQESMNTLSLITVSIPMAVGIGFAFGVWAYRNRRVEAATGPILDFMQTIPAFAYLIPILFLFGFGPVVGLIASIVFATPPMVRNTILGFRQIPAEIRESGVMSGCTRRQLFWWVEVPTAWPQMLMGVNQTTMAALSMIIIAAIIGGFEDIGWEVLSSMRKAQFGQSLLAGFVIALLAMLLDRITTSYARRQLPTTSHKGFEARNFAKVFAATALATLAIAALVEPLWTWNEAWTYYPAEPMNAGITYLIVEFGDFMESIKHGFLFYVLLPMKLGLSRAIAPFTWGFSVTPEMKIIYWIAVAVLGFGTLQRGRWQAAVATFVLGGLLYFGITGIAWPATVAVVSLLAFQVGGLGLALFACGSLLFILLTGMWEPAMLSVYLCTAAVVLCIVFGGLLGVWAAASGRVSAIVRPINDTLQTMPQFVLLIPALMLFRVGEFTALLAIIAYAIVPMIRYTEHGLRSVPHTLIEAGISCGCTRWQLFWQVRVPQALPQILLGINQTILFGLTMLVIAALVGTTGLGQQIYLALSKADAGTGIVAGLGMALIAMVADRILRAMIRNR